MSNGQGKLTPFERVIVHAARKQLCCSVYCTTCGSTEYLADGLLLLTRGLAPGQALWRELSRPARRQWSEQNGCFTPLDQELLVARAERAILADIAEAAGEAKWLPYLERFTSEVRAHEMEHGRLARSWRPQLRALFEPAAHGRAKHETGPLTDREVQSYMNRVRRPDLAHDTP